MVRTLLVVSLLWACKDPQRPAAAPPHDPHSVAEPERVVVDPDARVLQLRRNVAWAKLTG